MIIKVVHISNLTFLIIKQRFLGRIFLEKVFAEFKIKGYIFNHIEEKNVITTANSLDIRRMIFISNKIGVLLSGK